jgi:hypothetical protein
MTQIKQVRKEKHKFFSSSFATIPPPEKFEIDNPFSINLFLLYQTQTFHARYITTIFPLAIPFALTSALPKSVFFL